MPDLWFAALLFPHTEATKGGTRTGTHHNLSPGHTTGKIQPLVFLMILLLPSGAGAEEIIGGVESEAHSRPYMAHLMIFHKKSYICGGFLITHQFVLSAAHCTGRESSVTLGAHNVSKTKSTQKKLKAAKQIVHPKFNRNQS